MNNKLIFAVLAVMMLLASGCVSVIRVSDGNVSDDDLISTELDELEDDLEDMDEVDVEDSGLPTKTVVEGDEVSFPNLKATDPDGDPITYTFSSPLDDDGEWETEVGDAGRYTVTITASDGTSEVSQQVMLIVKSLNKAPVITGLAAVDISEGETVSLDPVVTDADGDSVKVTFSSPVDSSGEWQTDYNDAGKYTMTVTANDGKESVKKTVTISVNDVNRAPKIGSVDDIVVDEGETVSVSVTASDPDGDDVEVSFSEPLDNDGEWKTKIGDAGEYNVKVTATDGDLDTIERFDVVVNSVNKAPVLEGIADVEVDEGEKVVLSVTATDAEGDDVAIEFSTPFSEDGEWQTGYDDSGEYIVTITATDGFSIVEESITVTVNNRNRPPAFGEGAFD